MNQDGKSGQDQVGESHPDADGGESGQRDDAGLSRGPCGCCSHKRRSARGRKHGSHDTKKKGAGEGLVRNVQSVNPWGKAHREEAAHPDRHDANDDSYCDGESRILKQLVGSVKARNVGDRHCQSHPENHNPERHHGTQEQAARSVAGRPREPQDLERDQRQDTGGQIQQEPTQSRDKNQQQPIRRREREIPAEERHADLVPVVLQRCK